MKQWVKKIFLGALLIVGGTTAAMAASLDRIVAVVNDSVITQSQLNQQLRQTRAPITEKLRQQVLQHMIDVQLQLQAADKAGIKVSDAELDQAIDQIAQRNGLTLVQLQHELQNQKVNYSQYRQEIKQQMILSQLQQRAVGATVVVSPTEVAAMAEKLRKQPVVATDAQYHVFDMVVPLPEKPNPQEVAAAQARAQQLMEKLNNGADFRHTVLTGAADKPPLEGGDLGWHKLAELPDLFGPYVQKMQIGEVSEPIRAPNGFHLIKLVEKRGDVQQPQNMVGTHVQHILIKTTPIENDNQVKARLEKLRADIINGEGFAKAARTNSQDPGSAAKGGDLGWVEPGMLDPTFEAQMNKLKPGEISQPFKSSFGWHIVQVLARKNSNDGQAYWRSQAQQMVYQRKFEEAVKKWVEQLRKQAYIKIK